MSGPPKVTEFPDLSNKLTAPTKKSLFERQKAEAEAKRQREEAETAAVYEDFVKSFEDSNDTLPSSGIGHRFGDNALPGPRGGGGFGGAPRRHFAPTGPRGNMGPGSLGRPPPLSRKRAFDGSHPSQRNKEQGLFAFEDAPSGPVDAATAFRTSDDEDERVDESKAAERAAPKPTLHLSSLPPGTSPAVIKSLIPSSVTVDAVRILPPSGPGSTERKSMSAIVTLAKDTPASDIDTVVSGLQNRYLGRGFNLSLSRHLSSAALGSAATGQAGLASALSSLPFGAKAIYAGPGGSLSRAPPPNSLRGGFAPPESYGPGSGGQPGRGPAPVQVAVNPPSDITQLKLIHKTLEQVLTHGPEFEALLMSRPEVQRDEKWAWLWDPRSPGGVWYRWRLWGILTGSKRNKSHRSRFNDPARDVFEGGAPWQAPEHDLRFEFTTHLDEFVSDSSFSSEDEGSGDERPPQRRFNQDAGPPDISQGPGDQGMEKAYLNPLRKAKLAHLLARLPTTTAKLRKGDVARVTAFAIRHAGEGADEVVDMVVANIEKPFAVSGANPEHHQQREEDSMERDDDDNTYDRDRKMEKEKEKADDSSAKLIALYLISDILSSSSTSGVRHAWRYRQLFEAALAQRRIFEGLGRLEKELQWGRLRAEKWRRSVNSVLALWEGWCVFPQKAQERFADAFANPPLTEAEEQAEAEKEAKMAGAAKSKWKSVDVVAAPAGFAEVAPSAGEADVDGEPMVDEDVDGEPMEEDLDGAPLDEDFTGEPMQEDLDGEPMEEDVETAAKELEKAKAPSDLADQTKQPVSIETAAARARMRRPKAIDLFADSDEE